MIEQAAAASGGGSSKPTPVVKKTPAPKPTPVAPKPGEPGFIGPVYKPAPGPSIWNRLGTLAKDTGGALITGPRFVWDVATAPWNDDPHFNGFKNTFVSAGKQSVSGVVKPLGDIAELAGDIAELPVVKPVLKAIDTVGREYVREPLTTAELAYTKAARQHNLGALFEGQTWSDAAKQAQYVSFGQGFVGALGAMFPTTTRMLSDAGYEENVNKLNWDNQDEVYKFYNHGPQKFFSGVGDAAIQIGGDPTIIGGKAVKVVRGASWLGNKLDNVNKIKKVVDGVTEAENTTENVNKFSKTLDTFANSDAAKLRNHPLLKDAPDPIVYALGKATDRKSAGVVYRAALGDPNAVNDLKLLRPDLGNPIAKSLGDLDAHDTFLLSRESSTEAASKFPWEHQPTVDEVNHEIEALKFNDQEFANFWAVKTIAETPGGAGLSRSAGIEPLQSVQNFVASGRTAKIDIHQPTAFHKMYQVFSWPSGTRPHGHVDLNDQMSSQEVTASINSALKNKLIDPESANNLIEGYIGAATPEARAEQIYNIERIITRNAGRKHGIDLENVDAIYDQYKRGRSSALQSLKERGYAVDLDGSVFKAPIFESQTANTLPIMDFDTLNSVLRRKSLEMKSGVSPWVASNALNIASKTVYGMDVLNSLFKVGTLTRLGFPVRNGAESQLRIASTVGAMASLRHLGPGLKNLIYNVSDNVGNRLIDKITDPYRGMSYSEHVDEFNKINNEMQSISTQMAELDKVIYKDRDNIDLDALAHKHVLENIYEEHKSFLDAHSGRMAEIEKGAGPKRRMANGVSEYTGIDGTKYYSDEAFAGPFGDLHWNNSSSENTYMEFADGQANLLSRNLTRTGYGEIKSTDPQYFQQWAEILNRQAGNSVIFKKLAAGESQEDVIKWLKNTPEGRFYRIRMDLHPTDFAEHVSQVNTMMWNYLPHVDLQRMVANGEQLTPDLLRKGMAGQELPTIHGKVFEENLSLRGAKQLQSVTKGIFKLIGSMPEDAWSRHPLYAELFNRSKKNRFDTFTELNGRGLTTEEQKLAMAAAHRDALAGTKKILFNTDTKSNLAHLLRFVSPFFSAFENSAKTWARIVADKPQVATRANLIFTSPNRAGIATDAEGNPVPADQASMNDYIWLNVPQFMKDLPVIGQGLSSLDHMGLQKKSLDVIFQGEGLNVPVGPYVAAPISEIVKRQPQLEDSLKWAIPYGPDRNVLMTFLPPSVKRQITKMGGQNDPLYANTYALIYQTEMHKSRENGVLPKTQDQMVQFNKHVQDMTNAYWNMRSVANLVLPFAPTFKSPYKYYIDKFNQYKTDYGVNAQTQFWKDYGDDFFDFTTSLSKNNTGIGSTVTDVQNAKKYSDLVQKIAAIDPKYIGLITAAGRGSYQFSNAAYKWEQGTTIAPGSKTTFRGIQDPTEAFKENQVQLGWIKYNNFTTQLDTSLYNRGLHSYQQKGAEDLKAIKDSFVKGLGKQNKVWYEDLMDTNPSRYQKTVDVLNSALSDKKFVKDHGNDPTWKSVKLFLNTRDAIAQNLASRSSHNIEAKSNSDLKLIYYSIVDKLKQDDIAFSDIHSRYFTNDPVYNKVFTEVKK